LRRAIHDWQARFTGILKIVSRKVAFPARSIQAFWVKAFLPLLVASWFFAACAPSTPQSRIARNPEKFASLSTKQKDLVQQGKIAPGMTADAVLLAWGEPDRRFEGSSDKKTTARWDYFGTAPIYGPGYFYGGYGFGYGRYAPYDQGFPGWGYALGPEVVYVPDRLASVWFANQRVDSWERTR